MSSQTPPLDPHEGSEDDPPRALDPREEIPVVPPRRYQPASSDLPDKSDLPGKAVDRHRDPPTVMDRVVAASAPLSLLAFFLIGFGTGMWYIAWVVFLVPPALRAWNRP